MLMIVGYRVCNVVSYYSFANRYFHENRMPGMQVNVTEEWLLEQHPDWILYKCDRKTPASAIDFPNVHDIDDGPWGHTPLERPHTHGCARVDVFVDRSWRKFGTPAEEQFS